MAVAIQQKRLAFWYRRLSLSLQCGSGGSRINHSAESAALLLLLLSMDSNVTETDRGTGVYAMYTHTLVLYGVTDTPFLPPKVHKYTHTH